MRKILFVSSYSSAEISGTANTMRNIFDSVPEVEVVWLCISFDQQKKCESKQKTLVLDKSFARLNFYIWNKRWNNHPERKVNVSSDEGADKNIGLKGKIVQVLKGILDCEKIHLNANCLKEIYRFNPDIVYTVGGSIMVMKTALGLSQKLEIPMIMHFMDNWIDTIYSQVRVLSPFRNKVLSLCRQINSRSTVNFAISDPLALKMEQIYKKHYIALMNPVDIDEQPEETITKVNTYLKFIYGGSLSLNRWKNLLEIARAIKESNTNNEFIIYAPNEQIDDVLRGQFSNVGAVLLPYIPYNLIKKEYRDADVLVLASPSGENYYNFSKYSLSTKVPEYMSFGKPILIYAQEEQHVAEYIQGYDAGVVAYNLDDLKFEINKLYDRLERERLATNGLQCVKNNHSVNCARNKLLSVINICMENKE